jgi:hypothetical protein
VPGNRTRDPWICSHELWPLDHRDGIKDECNSKNATCEKRIKAWRNILIVLCLRPPLWSSGQSSWLQTQRSGFDSGRNQIFWEVVGVERDPLSLVSTIKELLGIKSCGLENGDYGRRDPSSWSRGTLADRGRSLGRYISLADSGYGVQLPCATRWQYRQSLITVVSRHLSGFQWLWAPVPDAVYSDPDFVNEWSFASSPFKDLSTGKIAIISIDHM